MINRPSFCLERQQAHIVATDWTVSDGPNPECKALIGGISIIEIPTCDEALACPGRFAHACRYAREVRKLGTIPKADQTPGKTDPRECRLNGAV